MLLTHPKNMVRNVINYWELILRVQGEGQHDREMAQK